jgi:hypothetical protein
MLYSKCHCPSPPPPPPPYYDGPYTLLIPNTKMYVILSVNPSDKRFNNLPKQSRNMGYFHGHLVYIPFKYSYNLFVVTTAGNSSKGGMIWLVPELVCIGFLYQRH